MTDSTSTQSSMSSSIYLDSSCPTAERVQDLLSRLTLDEKIGQMCNVTEAIPRLNIPAYDFWSEALHGVAGNGRATVFPQAIGMAATWDPTLIQKVASAVGDETRAKYHEALRRKGWRCGRRISTFSVIRVGGEGRKHGAKIHTCPVKWVLPICAGFKVITPSILRRQHVPSIMRYTAGRKNYAMFLMQKFRPVIYMHLSSGVPKVGHGSRRTRRATGRCQAGQYELHRFHLSEEI